MNACTPNLVLAGFMGTGKSTVAPIIAQRLGWVFVDTDALVEQRAGMPVREVFATQGEPAFRALEREVIRDACRMDHAVISIGGGALLDPANKRDLENSGVLVLLTCARDILVQRLRDSVRRGERPLLAESLSQTIDGLLRAREPAYSSVLLRVDTTRLGPEEAADEVLALYRQATRAEVPA